MPDITVREYEVRPGLGRHLALDPRSLAYRREYAGQPLHPAEWIPRLPVLDQSNLAAQGIHTSALFPGVGDVDALGSCTANAATAVLSIIITKEQAAAAGLDTSSGRAAEEFAIRLYADATRRDQWHDQTWPTQDCGSSGLGVAKALKHRGLIDQYGHATTAEELCALLQTGPVLMGVPWYSAFFTPDANGFVDWEDNWSQSPLEGGHEVCVTALEAVETDEHGNLLPERTVLRFRNSWSTSWGDNGDGRLRMSTYLALRSQIDLIQPRLDSSR